MRRRTFAAALLLPPFLARCAGDDLTKLVASDKVTTTTRDAGRAASLISEYRRSRGLPAVVADDRLNDAAVHQARAVAEAGRLSHGDFPARMQRFGILGSSAENLSAGSEDVAGAVSRWRASPGHDENLLLKGVHRIGLARADSPGFGYGRYWALVLAQ